MVNKFEVKVAEVDKTIEEEYLKIVTTSYEPLFQKLKDLVIPHMKVEGVSELKLIDSHPAEGEVRYDGLVFRDDGEFYNLRGANVNLCDLSAIQKHERVYVRHDNIPCSNQNAMRFALYNFRDRVKQFLDDII